MTYNILETNIKFTPNSTIIMHVLVLVEISKGDIRVIEATQQNRGGYMSIPQKDDHILSDLLQEVAGYGMEVTDIKRMPKEWVNKYFKP